MCPEGWRGASTGHIHRLGVYTGWGYTPVGGILRTSSPTLLSSMPNIAPHPNFFRRECVWKVGVVPGLTIYTGTGVYTQPVYMASRGTTPTFRTHSLLKKFWVWSNVGHAAQQRGRPVRGIHRLGVYPEPAVHAVEQHAQHCSTPKTFLEENVSGRLAWCLDWPYTPVGCIHRLGVYSESAAC